MASNVKRALCRRKQVPRAGSLRQHSPTRKIASPYGQLPQAWTTDVGLLLAEYLDVAAGHAASPLKMARELRHLADPVETKAAENKTLCTKLASHPDPGQAVRFRRTACLVPLLRYIREALDENVGFQTFAVGLGAYGAYMPWTTAVHIPISYHANSL